MKDTKFKPKALKGSFTHEVQAPSVSIPIDNQKLTFKHKKIDDSRESNYEVPSN